MTSILPMTPQVWAARVIPATRKYVALCLAELHDQNQGCAAASMADLSERSGLSVNQVRRHVHSLLADGVLEVATKFVGASGVVPHYRLVVERLQALTVHEQGSTPDLFTCRPSRPVGLNCHEFESHNGFSMCAELTGPPGARRVAFTRLGALNTSYGYVPLSTLLADMRLSCWNGLLSPADAADGDAPEHAVLNLSLITQIALWAQETALGRVESVEAA